MKSTKQLTHSAIAAAKPSSKAYKLSDTDRLYVLVATSGKKYWKWNYRLDGKDSTYTIGTFPAIKPAEARERRMAAEKIVADGVHPREFESEKITQINAEKATTFWAIADEWIQANKSKWTPKYAMQVETNMRRYIGDTSLGKKPIKAVTTPDIYKLIGSIANRTQRTGPERKSTGAHSLAILVLQCCRAVFRHALGSGHADRNPAADFKASDVIAKPKVKNNLALSQAQLRELLSALANFKGLRKTGIAMELLMLTFVRTGELRGATWDEFDLLNSLWTIPSHRMKVKTAGDHIVPLAPQAVRLLRELQHITGNINKGPRWLFPNERRGTEPMTSTTINAALKRMKFNGKGTIGFSGHGFRGTASTQLHEMGHPSDVIELQLAHQQRDSVKAAYNKATRIPERTAMMTQWAIAIDDLKVHACQTK